MTKAIGIVIFVFTLLSFTQCNSQTETKTKKMETAANNKTELKHIIVDVRTPGEWVEDGHADCSVNYPLDQFESKIEELKKYDKVTLVCRSGNRAGIALKQLVNAGYTKEVENLGAWQNLKCDN